MDIRSTVEDLAVKTRAVPWRGVQKGEWDWEPTGTPVLLPYPRQSGVPWWINSWLLPGETQFDTYKAVLGCGFKRRYRLRVTCRGVDVTTKPRKPTLDEESNAFGNRKKPFTSLELNNGLSARALLSLSRAASKLNGH